MVKVVGITNIERGIIPVTQRSVRSKHPGCVEAIIYSSTVSGIRPATSRPLYIINIDLKNPSTWCPITLSTRSWVTSSKRTQALRLGSGEPQNSSAHVSPPQTTPAQLFLSGFMRASRKGTLYPLFYQRSALTVDCLAQIQPNRVYGCYQYQDNEAGPVLDLTASFGSVVLTRIARSPMELVFPMVASVNLYKYQGVWELAKPLQCLSINECVKKLFGTSEKSFPAIA
ncbi:hypothetical protein RF11_00147 [Thelohanellus kitauei]|uniref:Uncharacterized protein n=1 Tax=Thelohanellus kitauei TaxID=669202 RepID=A0A0C2N1W5_THEKT|nr:hypothetical protein RF11_00147 [Thelohanellus kitauei]